MSDDGSGPIAVVGTGTGIGKTVVTAGLTRWLRDQEIDARAIKPAQTGYPPDDDAGFVTEACDDPTAATCPHYLEPALAPRVAADVADEPLRYESIRAACEREIDRTTLPLIEGIGGLRVPLTADRDVIDLVADLEASAIVVTRSGLGTLNHTALSIEAIERREIDVLGVVCNEYRAETVAERTNPGELERMTGYDVETVPPIEPNRDDHAGNPSSDDGTSLDRVPEPERFATGVHEALSSGFLEELASRAT